MDNQQISLAPWVELVGVLQRLFCDESYVYLEIANRLISFRQELAGSAIILNGLSKNMIGKKIGVLLTDLPDKPIIVRIFSTQNCADAPPAKIQPIEESNAAVHDFHEPTHQTYNRKSGACQISIDEYLDSASGSPKKNSEPREGL